MKPFKSRISQWQKRFNNPLVVGCISALETHSSFFYILLANEVLIRTWNASVPLEQSFNNHNEINQRSRALKSIGELPAQCDADLNPKAFVLWPIAKQLSRLLFGFAICHSHVCFLSLAGRRAVGGRTFPAARREKSYFPAWLWRVACTKALTGVGECAPPIQINSQYMCSFCERAAACNICVCDILVTRIARATRRNKIDPTGGSSLSHISICNGANETQKAVRWFWGLVLLIPRTLNAISAWHARVLLLGRRILAFKTNKNAIRITVGLLTS